MLGFFNLKNNCSKKTTICFFFKKKIEIIKKQCIIANINRNVDTFN